ncbi:unnamed protein product [Choristocarpus tenellus]
MSPALSVHQNQEVVSEFFQRGTPTFGSYGPGDVGVPEDDNGCSRSAGNSVDTGVKPAAMKEDNCNMESSSDSWRVEDEPLVAPPPPRSLALDPKGPVRKGKWTPEEEKYTTRIINDFTRGLLPLAPGTTLRSYLSEKLNCDPMRITKKFAGAACIGKRVFQTAERTPENLSESQRSRRELDDMARKFHARLDSMKPVRTTSKSNPTAVAAANAISPKTRRSTAQAAVNVGIVPLEDTSVSGEGSTGRSQALEGTTTRRQVSRSPSPTKHGPHSVYDDSAPHPEGSPSNSWDRDSQEGGYGQYDLMDQSPTSSTSSHDDISSGPMGYTGGGGDIHARGTCRFTTCAYNVSSEYGHEDSTDFNYQQYHTHRNHHSHAVHSRGGRGFRHSQQQSCSKGKHQPSKRHGAPDYRQGVPNTDGMGPYPTSSQTKSFSTGCMLGSSAPTRRSRSGPLHNQPRPIPESSEISDQDAGGLLLDFFRSVHEKVQTASEEMENKDEVPTRERTSMELPPAHPMLATKRGIRSISSPALTQFAQYAENLPRLEAPAFKRRRSVESLLCNSVEMA